VPLRPRPDIRVTWQPADILRTPLMRYTVEARVAFFLIANACLVVVCRWPAAEGVGSVAGA